MGTVRQRGAQARARAARSCSGLRKLNSSDTAMAWTRSALQGAIRPSISASASGVTTFPSAPMRSVIS